MQLHALDEPLAMHVLIFIDSRNKSTLPLLSIIKLIHVLLSLKCSQAKNERG